MDIFDRALQPDRVLRLLAGLQAIPDSLYRARLLEEHQGEQDTDKGREKTPVVLPWLGWDAKTMMLTDIRNLADAVTAAKYGGKHAKPSPVYPPGHQERHESHGRMSIREFAARAVQASRQSN